MDNFIEVCFSLIYFMSIHFVLSSLLFWLILYGKGHEKFAFWWAVLITNPKNFFSRKRLLLRRFSVLHPHKNNCLLKAFIFLKPDFDFNKTTRIITICVTSCGPNDFTCIWNGNAKTLNVWDRFCYVNITTGGRSFIFQLLDYFNLRCEKHRKYFWPQINHF